MAPMTPDEIRTYRPERRPAADALAAARARMMRLGLWHRGQQMGRSWPIGCVALEITQRCNLDCTLCYLSEQSEAVHDLPLAEVLRRIDRIHAHYGPGTDVQITGGDPTLRKRDELISIVAAVARPGMRPTLMTNGIKASRELLAALAKAGLADVAFHVDTTQQRKGYASETALNEIRQRYIERTMGLPLSVMFNTTVHQGNFHEIANLVRFFRRHAGAVRTVSFQLQADTGRGVERQRAALITPQSVQEQIQLGLDAALSFGRLQIGHPSCNRYGLALLVNGNAYDMVDSDAIRDVQARTQIAFRWDRTRPWRTGARLLGWLARHPRDLRTGLIWAGRRLWRMRADLMIARGRMHTLSFLIHNFMDACALDRERIDGCVFQTMTHEGPLSMCLLNAKRDEYILQPLALNGPDGIRYWQPLAGTLHAHPTPSQPKPLPLKRLKGRARARRTAIPS